MLKDDKKIVMKISKLSLKSNRLRNLFAIFGIILTTVLFTSLMTVGMNIFDSIQETTMRQVGEKAHGDFKYISYEQYDKLKEHSSINKIGYSVLLGKMSNPEIDNHSAELRCASDEWLADELFSCPTVGRMPVTGNELATDTIVLDYLGTPKEIGQNVTIEYELNGALVSDTFKLVGYWDGDETIPASMVWLSKEYTNKKLEGYTSMYDGDCIGSLTAAVEFHNSHNIEKKLQKVIIDSGYDINDIKFGMNWAYMNSSIDFDISTIIAIFLTMVLIIFCGYLIIYNIFSISVVNDIHYYGLLKAVGATQKQISSLIRQQTMVLCLIGIPIGLLGGFAIGVILTPFIFRTLNVSVINVSINPVVFLVATIFAVITVLISTHKPVMMAGKVSPIMALQSSEGNLDNLKYQRKRVQNRGKAKVIKMAFANVFRSKKKAILVVISLALSMVILNLTFSLSRNFDVNRYIDRYIYSDFVIGDSQYFNVNIGYKNQGIMTQKSIEDFMSVPGVEESGCIYFKEIDYKVDENLKNTYQNAKNKTELMEYQKLEIEKCLQKETVTSHVYGIDEVVYQYLTIYSGTVDALKFLSGDYILVSPLDSEGKISTYIPGDIVKIENNNGEAKSYIVMAVAAIPFNLGVRHTHLVTPEFILPSKEYISLTGNTAPMILTVNVKDEFIDQAENYINQYCKNSNSYLDYESKSIYKKDIDNIKQMFIIVGTVLSITLGLIGVMNYMNTMITSIITRRRELTLLQSIGMTSWQLKSMLVSEGIIYVLLTLVSALSVGIVLGQFIIGVACRVIWFLNGTFNVMPSLLCLPVLIIIAGMVPYICYSFMSRDSIVQRLRSNE